MKRLEMTIKEKDLSNSKNPRFTKWEEIANAISHWVGLAFGIVATVLMLVKACHIGTAYHIIWASIFGFGLILLYCSSMLNHSLPSGTKWKDFFHNFDQIAIYFLIAWTYTPIALIWIRNIWWRVLFGLQWWFALIWIILKIFMPNKFEKGVNTFIVISYAFMGWMLLYFIYPLYAQISAMWMWWLFIWWGLYTLGIIAFKLEKVKYMHLIWHLAVLAGSVCHWIAIMRYILPIGWSC